MFYAYVLKSKMHDYFYKGHCQDLDKRLAEHNAGKTQSNRPYLPFEIVYFEEFESESGAIQREKYFKTSRGRKFLKKMLTP
ncbi:GIY-YIG nuclease family protein [Algoriphagus aquimarinus]|uniref:GIY-YIG nuclease family protein n=1 Tax=Algoriphagus aquimarinus TaxID=237018 RepID=A0A5C7B1M8_9BACT|nr:GIY-YIG nuclease family protein [Algoriphagus aquimarinus]TXE14327.1 GIY-YIG nuclease family protein [Algoriphagus aquimarinus]